MAEGKPSVFFIESKEKGKIRDSDRLMPPDGDLSVCVSYSQE